MARCKNVTKNQILDFDKMSRRQKPSTSNNMSQNQSTSNNMTQNASLDFDEMSRRQNPSTSNNMSQNQSSSNNMTQNATSSVMSRLSQSSSSSDEVDLDLSHENVVQQNNMASEIIVQQTQINHENMSQNSTNDIQGGNDTLSQNLPSQDDSMVVNYNWFLNETIDRFEEEIEEGDICHSQNPGPVSIYTQEISEAPTLIDEDEENQNTNWRQISLPVAPPAPPCSQETEQQLIPLTINIISKHVPPKIQSRPIFKIPFIPIYQKIKKTPTPITKATIDLTQSTSSSVSNIPENNIVPSTSSSVTNIQENTIQISSQSPPLNYFSNCFIIPPPPPPPPSTQIPPPPPSPPLRLSQIPLPPNPAPVTNLNEIPLDKSLNHGDDTFDDDFISVSSQEQQEPQPSTSGNIPNSSNNNNEHVKQQTLRKAVQIPGKKLPSKYNNNMIRNEIIIAISDEDSDDSDFIPDPLQPIKKTEPQNEIVDQERIKKDKINARRRFLRQWHKENPGQKFPREKKTTTERKKKTPKKKQYKTKRN